MISKEQMNWLAKLSDTKIVEIKPYNPEVKLIFQQQRTELLQILGDDTEVIHEGASAWGISGKGDVDIYIPVKRERFDESVYVLTGVYGEPGSHYPYERVRWNRMVNNIEIEIFITNKDSLFWENSLLFWNYIKSHPEALAGYESMKERAAGMNTREYYTRKTIYINQIMELARNEQQKSRP